MSIRGLSKRQKDRIFCNHCRTETNHTCVGEHIRNPANDAKALPWADWERYRLWICDGCEEGTLELVGGDESTDPQDKPEILADSCYFDYYPPRTLFHVQGKKFAQLPEKLNELYREVLLAINNNVPLLCAIGIRALIEGICADKEIPGRSLEAKIEELGGLLPKNIIAALHGIRFIGNVAAHELVAPSREELHLAIEICEDLLNYLYDLDYKARNMALTQGTKKLFSEKPVKGLESGA